jgi:HEAT repeat protein
MHSLPHRPNLRHLRRQARELQRESGSPLHESQHELAETYGFRSWAELKHEVEELQRAALACARYTGTPRRDMDALRGAVDTTVLVAGLRHPNPRVRYDCLELLDHLADDSCLMPMIAATADPVPRVRRVAVHALGCRRCKPEMLCDDLMTVFEPIALADPAWRVRMEAVISIFQQPLGERRREVMERAAEQDPDERVRTWATRLLARSAPDS